MSHQTEDFERILEIWGSILGADRVVLGFLDDKFNPVDTYEWAPPGAPPAPPFASDGDMTRFTWAMERLLRNEIIFLDDMARLPAGAREERAYLTERRLDASAWIPILSSSGQLRGIMGFTALAGSMDWQPEDLRFLRISSELIGNYHAAARAERDLRQSEQRLHRMNRALMELNRSPEYVDADTDGLTRRMAADISQTLGVEHVQVWLVPGPETSAGEGAASPADALGPIAALLSDEECPARHPEVRAFAVPDAVNDPRLHRFPDRCAVPAGVGALLCAPVMLEGRFRGAICCQHTGGPRPWTPEEENFIASMADLLSLALARRSRREADQAYRDSEARVRAMFEGSVMGIVFCTLDGYITESNAAFTHMTGYSADELRGAHWRDLTHPDDIAQENTVTDIIAAGTQNWIPFTKRYIRKDGSFFWANMTLYVVHQEGNAAEFGFAMVEDITDRRCAEAQLLAYQEQLRSLANELSLAEARLRRKIAGDLHDRIGQTLALIKLKLGDLRSDAGTGDGGKWRETVDLVEETIRETRSLISEISPPVLDLLGLEAAAEWLVEHLSQQSGIPILLDTDHKPKPLAAEAQELLFQGIRELLVNAIKHAGATRIRVSLRRDHGQVRAVVEDDGRGFDAAPVPPPASGGFGLFYLRERMGFMGGRLEVGRAKDGGARVTLNLPLSPPAPAQGGDDDAAHPARG